MSYKPARDCALWGEYLLAAVSPIWREHSIPWPVWDDGAGGPPDVVGDPNWGKLQLYSGDDWRSDVIDLGNADPRQYTLTEDTYEAGQGATTLRIRGSAAAFSQDDILPAWEVYAGSIVRSWRYVQARESNP